MSEITKLYENVGVLKECLSPCYINKTWRKTHDCPNCDNRENYPPFTAEKQIELIKWFAVHNRVNSLLISNEIDFSTKQEYYKIGMTSKYVKNLKFEEALAGFINKLEQDLTEEEKEQIKNILKG